MVDVKIKQAKNIETIDVDIGEVKNIDPVTIASIEQIEKIAPAAVHIKELNHVDPLSIESLRIDQLRNLDPLEVARFDVTHLPTVNVTLGRMPGLDLNVRRVPPVAIAVQQEFCLPSRYTIFTKFLGMQVLRFEIAGQTMVRPKDKARREQSHNHERTYPDVAPVGNPAIPVTATETSAETVTRPVPARPPGLLDRLKSAALRVSAPGPLHRAPASAPPPPRPQGPAAHGHAPQGLSVGGPRFQYSLPTGPAMTSSVGSG